MVTAELSPAISAEPQIDVVDTISPKEFKREYIDKNQALLMRKVTANWPAMKKWSFDFFAGLQLTEACVS